MLCLHNDQADCLPIHFVFVPRLSAIRLLGEDSLESSRSVYPVLSKLHCVTQIQDTLQLAIRWALMVVSICTAWMTLFESIFYVACTPSV